MGLKHNRTVFLWLLALTVLAGHAPSSQAEPVFGRYTGTLHHEARGRDQLAKLDFIVARTGGNQLDLKAVLTLHMGGFDSGEYVSVHFAKVRYNVVTGALVFDDPSQPFSLFVRKFSGKELEGELISLWNGKIGKLSLSAGTNPVRPSAPLIEPLWGEYQGNCGVDRARLQIFTFRNPDGNGHLAQPFGSYAIKANMPLNCQDGQCLNLRFTAGTYNFLGDKEQLNLVGPHIAIRCSVDGDELHCSTPDQPPSGFYDLTDCRLRRTSGETQQPRTLQPPEHAGAFQVPVDPSGAGSLDESELGLLQSGEYKGYVFHEYLGKYQAASVNVIVFPGDPEEGTRISASGRLFFGEHGSPEVIPYRFSEVDYPSPTVWPQNLVLHRPEDDVDAVVQITEVGKDVIRGHWFSNIFGRVGPFVMRRDALPALPAGARKVERLSGYYRGERPIISGDPNSRWIIRMQVANGNTPPGQSGNPFFPNEIRGSMQLFPVTAAIPIAKGSYDFYTGRFAFMMGGKELEYGWAGTQLDRNVLHLYRAPVPVALTPVPRFKPQVFRLVEEFQP